MKKVSWKYENTEWNSDLHLDKESLEINMLSKTDIKFHQNDINSYTYLI